MRVGYVEERDLDSYPYLTKVKRLESPNDVATVLEAYLETRALDTETFKQIKDVYEDNEGHYYMVLTDRNTGFDILEFINDLYRGTLKITAINIGLMFPQSLSKGLGDLDRPMMGRQNSNRTAKVSGFYDVYHDRNVDIPQSFVRGKQFFVGRSQNSDYTLAPCPRSDKISRSHCGFYYQGSDLYLEDSQSNNGTYLNNRKIPKGMPQKLNPGDIVRIVDCELEIK